MTDIGSFLPDAEQEDEFRVAVWDMFERLTQALEVGFEGHTDKHLCALTAIVSHSVWDNISNSLAAGIINMQGIPAAQKVSAEVAELAAALMLLPSFEVDSPEDFQ